MNEPTSLLFGLTEFEVVDVTPIDSGVQVTIEVIALRAAALGAGCSPRG